MNNNWEEVIKFCEEQKIDSKFVNELVNQWTEKLIYFLPVPIGTTVWRVCQYYIPDTDSPRGWIRKWGAVPIEYEPGLKIDYENYFIDADEAAVEVEQRNMMVGESNE